MDKSLFFHKSLGEQIWVIGLTEMEIKKIRLEIIKERSSEILKKIILHNVSINNTIISDQWEVYN